MNSFGAGFRTRMCSKKTKIQVLNSKALREDMGLTSPRVWESPNKRGRNKVVVKCRTASTDHPRREGPRGLLSGFRKKTKIPNQPISEHHVMIPGVDQKTRKKAASVKCRVPSSDPRVVTIKAGKSLNIGLCQEDKRVILPSRDTGKIPIQGTKSLISGLRQLQEDKITPSAIDLAVLSGEVPVKQVLSGNLRTPEEDHPYADYVLPGSVPIVVNIPKVLPNIGEVDNPSEGLESVTYYMPKKRKSKRPKGPDRGDGRRKKRREKRLLHHGDLLGIEGLGIADALERLPSPTVIKCWENDNDESDDSDTSSVESLWSFDSLTDIRSLHSASSTEEAIEDLPKILQAEKTDEGPIAIQLQQPGTGQHVTFIDNGVQKTESETNVKKSLRKRFVSYCRYLKWKLFH